MASVLSRDLIYLIWQFLDEEKLKETFHTLEQESRMFFNFKFFEDLVMNGSWDEVERYLSGFTKVEDNRHSMQLFFEVRKQKFLEALESCNRGKAVDILFNELKMFASFNEELFKEITLLLTLDDFRENVHFRNYKDAKTARTFLLMELKKLINANPLFRDKLQFPNIKGSRLRTLLNQSLNWQHSLCGNPRQTPEIRTLFVDHTCRTPMQRATSNQPLGSPSKTEGFRPTAMNGAFQPTSALAAPVQAPLTSWMPNPSSATPTHPVVSGPALSYGCLTSGIPVIPQGLVDSEASRLRTSGASDRIMVGNSYSQTHRGYPHNITDELPKTVARTLKQGSVPISMDFHPIQQTLLLVGTSIGDISLWEVSSREKLVSKNFQVWDIGASSMILKASIIKDPCVSVKRILWSPDGSLFGVAHSKHILQLYTYYGGRDIRNHLEIEAHMGSVNDLAFCNLKQLSVVTCGDDKTIKVWDVATGAKVCTFEGHDAPVYSVCPHSRENVNFLFSTSVDGKIKAWLYDSPGAKIDYGSPGQSSTTMWCTTMVYTADGKRLFSCGTNQDGESHMVEWSEVEGLMKRTYQGLHRRSLDVVQSDTTKNRFLAVGDDYLIKFWEMDNTNILTTVDAEGNLPASPRIRFNKDGTLLAVSTKDNKIKILATVDGLRLMHTSENQSLAASGLGNASEMLTKNWNARNLEDVKPRLPEEPNNAKTSNIVEINDSSLIQSLRLPDDVKVEKIARLIYASSGSTILALASNGIHLVWRWRQDDTNLNGKVTTKVSPQLMQQPSGIFMTNDLADANPEEAVSCFALSTNDSYVISASGGRISLYNTVSFKKMATFLRPRPAATYIAFHPQDNNVIAIGMSDSTINIYDVRSDEVKCRLRGHSKRISGLAFSAALNVFVSGGADDQIVVWSSDDYEKKKNTFVKIPSGKALPGIQLSTEVQFHQDQIHFLVVHQSQLAIYETTKLECRKQWINREFAAPISHATFSCDGQLVYSSFVDGTLRIFNASNLQVRRQINPSVYLSSNISYTVYPVVVAANPQEANQFAIGLTDGSVLVFEPLESESDRKWSVSSSSSPVENWTASNAPPVHIIE